MNDHFMGPLQAVVRERSRPGPREPDELVLLPNPDSLPPRSVAQQVEQGRALRLAPPDIASLAEFGRERGFHIARFQLVDRNFDLIPEPLQTDLSDRLVEAFRADGPYGLSLVLSSLKPSVFINGVEFFLPKGVRLDVRRGGVVFSNNQPVALEFMRSAWRKLSLR